MYLLYIGFITTTIIKKSIGFQKSYLLTLEIYKLTKKFPREELYGLTSQIRRSASSIAFNIAEGLTRGQKEIARFFEISRSSGGELETQIMLAKDLGYITEIEFEMIDQSISEIMKILNKSITTLRTQRAEHRKRIWS